MSFIAQEKKIFFLAQDLILDLTIVVCCYASLVFNLE